MRDTKHFRGGIRDETSLAGPGCVCFSQAGMFKNIMAGLPVTSPPGRLGPKTLGVGGDKDLEKRPENLVQQDLCCLSLLIREVLFWCTVMICFHKNKYFMAHLSLLEMRLVGASVRIRPNLPKITGNGQTRTPMYMYTHFNFFPFLNQENCNVTKCFFQDQYFFTPPKNLSPSQFPLMLCR